MHGHELFIKILLNDEYLSKDMAENGVKFAQSCAEPRANGLVGLLKDYINKQDSSQATVTPDELSKDGYISSLKSWLATTLAHSHHMADSISKQLIEWLKINKRNNQNIFAYLISNEALNKDSSALNMVTQILNLLGDPLKKS